MPSAEQVKDILSKAGKSDKVKRLNGILNGSEKVYSIATKKKEVIDPHTVSFKVTKGLHGNKNILLQGKSKSGASISTNLASVEPKYISGSAGRSRSRSSSKRRRSRSRSSSKRRRSKSRSSSKPKRRRSRSRSRSRSRK